MINSNIFSCKKDKYNNGNVLVTVKYNNEAIAHAGIYLKKGNNVTSVVPSTNFDKQIGADAIGQAYFENLPPDTYTIFAKGFSQQAGKQVTGKTVIQIKTDYQEVTVDTK